MPTKNKPQQEPVENAPEDKNEATTNGTPQTAPSTVEVKKDKLDAILEANETLQKQVTEQAKTIEMLLATADKSRIAKYQERSGSPRIYEYRVRTFKDQVVTSWRMVRDEMFKDNNGHFHENQIVEITTEDGSTYQLPYLESERLTKITGSLLGKSTNWEGDREVTTLNLQLPEGKTIKIDQRYVN